MVKIAFVIYIFGSIYLMHLCSQFVQIVMDRVDLEYENEGKKPDVLHRSKEQRYYFDRIFNE